MVGHARSSSVKENAEALNNDDDLWEDGCDGSSHNDYATKKVASDFTYNRKFIIARGDMKEKKIYKLRHPRSSTAALYAISSDSVEELLRFEDPNRSFFYGESVVEDGSITMLCAIHPLFLVIPYLLKNAKECFVTIENILVDEEFPAVALLINNEKLLRTLDLVCEHKCVSDVKFWRYNEAMILDWLEGRFEKLKRSLCEKAVLHKAVRENDDVLRRYTFLALSDYIPQILSVTLKEYLKIKDLEIQKTVAVQPLKRKLENSKEVESYYDPNENAKHRKRQLTTTQKKLEAASKGTKSILGFFNIGK